MLQEPEDALFSSGIAGAGEEEEEEEEEGYCVYKYWAIVY